MFVHLTVIDFHSKQSESKLTDNLITQPPTAERGRNKKEKEIVRVWERKREREREREREKARKDEI